MINGTRGNQYGRFKAGRLSLVVSDFPFIEENIPLKEKAYAIMIRLSKTACEDKQEEEI